MSTTQQPTPNHQSETFASDRVCLPRERLRAAGDLHP